MPAPLAFAEFRKAHPAVRCFAHYTPEQRANHAASTKLSKTEQNALGRPFYVHPMCPQDRGYDSAKDALVVAYSIYSART